MAKQKKSGPLTQPEIDFISLNHKHMSISEIAESLGRNPETVEKHVKSVGAVTEKAQILDLKRRQDWKQIQQQFTEDEIELFKAHWAGVVQQFSEEIYYTESLQIIAAIKHDILSNRVLHDQMKIKNTIAELEDELLKERKSQAPDKDTILALENQISAYCMAEQANGKEFREGSSRLMAVLKDLKALRADRISKVDDMKKSFASFMKGIIEDTEMKRECGGWMEKCRLAAEQEYLRLGKLHKYANGEWDRPILNSSTVNFNDEPETEKDNNEQSGITEES